MINSGILKKHTKLFPIHIGKLVLELVDAELDEAMIHKKRQMSYCPFLLLQ